MFDATAPPKDEDVRYVGLWLDDHGSEESYYRDRWAPFVRCVIHAVAGDAAFQRHPRPIFEGTSFANIWSAKFRRATVEGFFVEVPRELAAQLVEALRTRLSVRGVLLVDEIEFPNFFGHMLATRAWLVGDVCVADEGEVDDDLGIRTAVTKDHENDIRQLTREHAEAELLDVVSRGIIEPKHASQAIAARTRVETIVLRTEYDAWSNQHIVSAQVALFDMSAVGEGFEARLIEVVAKNLIKKGYKSEVVLWLWAGFSADAPRAFYAAITSTGKVSAGALFKGIDDPVEGPRVDKLSDMARPLLRWQPEKGLTRFWKESPPPDTSLSAGKNTAELRHRIPGVVRRAVGDALDFRIERLAIENVRGHEKFEHAFPSRFLVIIGDNGRGKTTILDAVAAILRVLVDRKDRGDSLTDSDVSEHLSFHGESFSTERRYPAKITAALRMHGREATTESVTREESSSSREGGLSSFMERLVTRVRAGVPVDLPLCVYYRVARAHQPQEYSTLDLTAPESRLAGYENAFALRLDPIPFQRWFKTMELAALQERKPNALLEVVREAVRQCIDNCETVQHIISRDEIVVRFKDGQLRPFRQLSDGYRLTLAMVADLAWRCFTLNPHLGPAALQETSGVVLIDEIEMHLHPLWQRRIVGDLRSTFPKLQFIATTHSPFIVQSMKAEEVIPLSGPEQVDEQPYKLGIEEVSEELLGVENVARSAPFLEMQRAAEELIALLDRADKPDASEIENARTRYLQLAARYSDDPAYLAVLKAEGAVRGVRLDERTPEASK